MESAPPLESPATEATDDVLVLVFKALAEAFCSPTALTPQSYKSAAARFIWFRTTLPLVCKRWNRLVLGTPALWSCCIINPAAEVQHVRRSARQHQYAEGCAGASPTKPAAAAGGFFWERTLSESSTPNRGASPVLGSSPDSDSSGYWTSQLAPYQPGGASPRHISQRLSRLSSSRHHHHPSSRASLSAAAVIAWVRSHPAAASGITCLSLDLRHHLGCHDLGTWELDALLTHLTQITRVQLSGAGDGTDAYEPLARLRQLRDLELSSASQSSLDDGLLSLCFLPSLSSLSVSLDIPPAFPLAALRDLPAGLQSLQLGAMWMEELSTQLADCKRLSRIALERCQIEHNPLPLLLTLPSLASIIIRTACRGSSDASLPLLLPMSRPQQQQQQQSTHSSNGSSSWAAAGLRRLSDGLRGGGDASLPAGGSSRCYFNTSVTSLALIDVGLRQLPACVSQLVALQDLQLALNHDMGLNPATCLPQELTSLSGLVALTLGHCGLTQLPPVLAALTGLTRLELQGNALSAAGFSSSSIDPVEVGFRHSLRVLDLTAQGSGRSRMRGVPAWVGQCSALTELRLGCSCFGGSNGSSGLVAAATTAAATAASPRGPSQRVFHHSSSDVGALEGHGRHGSSSNIRSDHRSESSTTIASLAGQQPGARSQLPSPARRLGLGTSASAPAGPSASAHLSATAAAASTVGPGGEAAAGPGAGVLFEGLSVQQLPVLLCQLEVLVVEGGMWEQRAVREALQLVRQLERSGSKLQVVLPL